MITNVVAPFLVALALSLMFVPAARAIATRPSALG